MAAGELVSSELLVTDCQTTGSSPETGHLLEAAWVVARADDFATDLSVQSANAKLPDGEVEVHSALALLPDDETIPPRISRLTGITPEMLDNAMPPAEIWSELCIAAGQLPCLAHYARFEERFYRRLHEEHGSPGPFPLKFICTHRIACRLLPDLPRRGLRALAGYFGHPLPELKRAADHVRATLFIWSCLVETLVEAGVTTFAGLDDLLAKPRPARGRQWVVPLAREERLALSDGPGVYRFINAAGNVIYVGKATSLKSRVNSYYRKRKRADKELEIVSQAVRVETQPTETRLEAALLEAAEIKRCDPPYNTALRVAGRAFGSAAEVAQLAAEAWFPLGRTGPVADTTLVGNWFRLVGGLNAGALPKCVAEEIWHTLWLEHHAPCDPEMLEAGSSLFLSEHDLQRGAGLALALRTLGRNLWLEAREREQQEREARAQGGPDEVELPEEDEEQEEAEDLESEDEEEVEVTPELVAGRLTGLTSIAGHQLRRGRWIRMIADAAICWKYKHPHSPVRRCVILRGGAVMKAIDLDPDEMISACTVPPVPSPRQRHELTLEAWDLLRVLTTELRRLVQNGSCPEVWVTRDTKLAGNRLKQILELV